MVWEYLFIQNLWLLLKIARRASHPSLRYGIWLYKILRIVLTNRIFLTIIKKKDVLVREPHTHYAVERTWCRVPNITITMQLVRWKALRLMQVCWDWLLLILRKWRVVDSTFSREDIKSCLLKRMKLVSKWFFRCKIYPSLTMALPYRNIVEHVLWWTVRIIPVSHIMLLHLLLLTFMSIKMVLHSTGMILFPGILTCLLSIVWFISCAILLLTDNWSVEQRSEKQLRIKWRHPMSICIFREVTKPAWRKHGRIVTRDSITMLLCLMVKSFWAEMAICTRREIRRRFLMYIVGR